MATTLYTEEDKKLLACLPDDSAVSVPRVAL